MSAVDEVVARIDRQALVKFALEICNIDSAIPHEASVAEHIYQWLGKAGFQARKVGLLADRFNVMGTLPGTGGGYSLLFNSHMDTAVPREFDWVHKDYAADVYHKAWVEDDELVGEGIVNDKGPMAAFLIAAKAIKDSGVKLRGDLLVTSVVAETSHEPTSDTPPGTVLQSKELGARFLVTHGGVADYALIAEGTGFGLVWVEAGKAWFKITFLSDQPPFYTPYFPDRTTPAESPSMVVRAAAAIQALEKWAADYQRRYTYDCAGGTVVPKVQVGAVRAGDPTRPILCPQIASLYVDVRTVPGQDPLAVREEMREALAKAGVPASSIELYHFRRGYEAKNIERLADAVKRAHVANFGSDPKPAFTPTSSMWRDINVFNEVGIPALTYGPRSERHSFKRSIKIETLYQAACVYARVALDLCNQEKRRSSATPS
jgi:acetylornithine deacetylase/succinyl-diaminopimelate desuccinylase-like protein